MNISSPPLGWNSWDAYGAGITEEELLKNAKFVADELPQYEYITCDIEWFEPSAIGNNYNNFATLVCDDFGRLLPAENRFPSAKNGVGFKIIADKIHAMGLKFGIHILRGIPRQAVYENLPIKGTDVTARQIAHPNSICPWNTSMYGLKDCEGAQAYYNSIFELYASWDIDFVKVDDISVTEYSLPTEPYSAPHEIEMIARAIKNCGRDMVLSLSPGPAPVDKAEHLSSHANMWRMTGDFWDRWSDIYAMFARCKSWQGKGKIGAYPDCDMLPLGTLCVNDEYLGQRGRRPRFSFDEIKTMLTLWGIFGSPLIIGGVAFEIDDDVLSLLKNPEYIKMNQSVRNSREIKRQKYDDGSELIVWSAQGEEKNYIAYFNAGETELMVYASNSFDELWTGQQIAGGSPITIKPHSCMLFSVKK